MQNKCPDVTAIVQDDLNAHILRNITKTSLFKYTENFATKKWIPTSYDFEQKLEK